MPMKYSEQRVKNMFDAQGLKPFKLSRSRIQNFLECPLCFYLDRKCGTDHPQPFPYTLNNVVDSLLKKEFDAYRAEKAPHPIMIEGGIDAVPFSHPDLNHWRNNKIGIQHVHEPTNLTITGAVDDIWVNSEGELIVVDYKATGSSKEVTIEDKQSYKNQMDVYQWLLRRSGFKVSSTAYFVYCSAISDRAEFQKTLEFKIKLLPYNGDESWIESTLLTIKKCLEKDTLPASSETCNFCRYRAAVQTHLIKTEV